MPKYRETKFRQRTASHQKKVGLGICRFNPIFALVRTSSNQSHVPSQKWEEDGRAKGEE